VTSPWFDRAAALHRLGRDDFDVLVVGGGITGAGVALDAASRGLRTGLVERDDFAAGTSGRSSKLVHGGLRYLDQGEVRLVGEALAERQRLVENAPHLVSILPFLLPVLEGDRRPTRRYAPVVDAALWAYDLVGGLRIGHRHQRITVDDALAHFPTLDRARLRAAFVYFDAQADDARLTLTVARTAALHGAAVANHARVTGFVRHGARVVGATLEADGAEVTVRARTVVNATGVWADDVRALDEGTHPASMRPAKGVHITLPWRLVRNDVAAVLPTRDGYRSVFVVPWDGHTYVGTTDTPYEGPLDDPRCTDDDVRYLLAALDDALTVDVLPRDVVATWAGVRPLLRGSVRARTADLSRRHSVMASPSGVVTVTGGKLTTYRRMAADAVDAVARLLPGDTPPSRTKALRLAGSAGAPVPRARLDPPGHRPMSRREHLRSRYGADAGAVQRLADSMPTWGDALVPGLPYLRAEAVYAVREEMARSLDDVLSRRTRARVLDHDATAVAAPAVAALLAPERGWSPEEVAAELARFADLLARDRP
jgi:glycerol-3-phosphate dehydrogenase